MLVFSKHCITLGPFFLGIYFIFFFFYYSLVYTFFFFFTILKQILQQYFGHLMQRADSLEKTLMLEKIKDRRRREQ